MGSFVNDSPATEPFFAELCAIIARVAAALDIRFILVGAAARDLVLQQQDRPTLRRTKDVDFGVRVRNWAEYAALRQALIDTGKFTPDRAVQRLLFVGAVPVDLVPFGGIASADGQIAWPSDPDTRLNVVGFEDAYQTATVLEISSDPQVSVWVVSATGLVILKFLAWEDRRQTLQTKDAVDLYTLIRSYLDFGHQERLSSDHPDLLAQPDFDYELAGARLLGRDLRQQASPEARAVIRAILQREVESNALAAAATRETYDTDLMVELLDAIREELSA